MSFQQLKRRCGRLVRGKLDIFWSVIWMATVLAWVALTAIALFFAAQNWITGGPYGRLVWPRNISVALIQWWTWCMLAPLIILFSIRCPLEPRRLASVLIWAFGLLALYLFHNGLVTAAERFLDRVTPGEPLGLTFENLLKKRAGVDLVTLGSLVLLGYTTRLKILSKNELARRSRVVVGPESKQNFIAVPKGDRIMFVSPSDIQRLEAAGNYVILHVGSEQHLIRGSLKCLSDRLSSGFIQCSRSSLVNVNSVIETKDPTRNGDLKVVLKSGDEVRVTRNFRRKFLDQLPLLN